MRWASYAEAKNARGGPMSGTDVKYGAAQLWGLAQSKKGPG